MTALMHPDSDLGKQWRDKLAKKRQETATDVGALKETTTEAVHDAIDTVKSRRESLPTLSEVAESRPGRSLKHLSDEVSGAIAGLGDKDAPDIKALVETHVAPRIVELRQRAAHMASDVVATSSEDGTAPAAQAGKRFTESLAHAEQALEAWRGAAVGHVESAQTQVHAASVQAKQGGKNAAASVFWLGAAAAVVYGGLLNEQQRQWVNEKSKAVAAGTVGLVQDLRGRDGDFTS